MKKLSIKFKNFLTEAGVSSSLFFLMLKLTGVNAYSLHFIFNQQHHTVISWLVAIAGGVAFALPTVVIMHKSAEFKFKKLLPILDGLLVFGGLNLHFFDQMANGTANGTAIALSVIFAVFTGVLTYGLGKISSDETLATVPFSDYNRQKEQLQTLLEKHEALKSESSNFLILQNEFKQVSEEALLLKDQNKKLAHENEKATTQFHLQLQQLKQLEDTAKEFKKEFKDHALFKETFIKYELSRIRKKKNSEHEEKEFLKQYS